MAAHVGRPLLCGNGGEEKEPSLPLLRVFKSPPGGVRFFVGAKKGTKKSPWVVAPPLALYGQESDQIGSAPESRPLKIQKAASDSKEPLPPICQLLSLKRLYASVDDFFL